MSDSDSTMPTAHFGGPFGFSAMVFRGPRNPKIRPIMNLGS
jgi:hypothetical protein